MNSGGESHRSEVIEITDCCILWDQHNAGRLNTSASVIHTFSECSPWNSIRASSFPWFDTSEHYSDICANSECQALGIWQGCCPSLCLVLLKTSKEVVEFLSLQVAAVGGWIFAAFEMTLNLPPLGFLRILQGSPSGLT